MKRINTAYRNEEPISLEDLKDFLQGSIYEEEFIVLIDDKSPDYMQMAEQGDTFVLEVRLHRATIFGISEVSGTQPKKQRRCL